MSGDAPVIVAKADSPVQAELWLAALRDAGIQGATYERGVGGAFGGAVGGPWSSYPVLVAREAVGQARSVIAEMDGASVLQPLSDPSAVRAQQTRILLTAGAIVGGGLLLAAVVRLLV